METNTTTPGDPPYLWVEESNQRSTFGILSFCLSTMIICVWSTLHFNIPTRRYTSTRRFWVKIAWMLIALLAPEFLLYLAINERINAAILLKKALKSHPHLAKPGLLARISTYIRGLATPRDNITPRRYFTLTHAFYAGMGGFAFYANDDDGTLTVEESLFELSTNPHYTVGVPGFKACIYIVQHFPNIFTDIPEKSILERSESSSLSKALLIVQVAWFCTNCASRLIQRLPLSLLEVTTAAHAFCTLLTYFVWWSKPLNVASPTIMKGKEAREVHALLSCSSVEYSEALKMAEKMAEKMAAGDSSMRTKGSKNDRVDLAANLLQYRLNKEEPPHAQIYDHHSTLGPGSFAKSLDMGLEWITLTLPPIFYGVVHFLAWGETFPSDLERSLWLASAVVVTCSGLTAALSIQVGFFLAHFTDTHTAFTNTIHALLSIIVAYTFLVPMAHMLASGFLIGESFRQLFFLNPAAYQRPSWPNYWPHLS